LIVTGTLLAFFHSEATTNVSQRTLTFAEREAYQRAIEDVYWRHRIWPRGSGERPDPKPSLDAVMSQAQLEKKVADYLRKSQALEDHWQRPITAEQLQVEMDRMAKHTKQPEVLRELFEALGNDPFVIAECLARPALAERLLTNWYAYDQRINGDLKQRVEADLLTHPTIDQMKQLSGNYSEIELIRSDSGGEANRQPVGHGVQLSSREWDETVQKLAAMFTVTPSQPGNGRDGLPGRPSPSARSAIAPCQSLPIGKLSPLQEDETRFYATAVIEKTDEHLKLAAVSWLKEPLESWLARAQNEVTTRNVAANANYTIPHVADGTACIEDTWIVTNAPPDERHYHTAVWTGTEMIVWGGLVNTAGGGVNTGGRYNPSTDSWFATSTSDAPAARYSHTAVWTGTEMIIWGAPMAPI